MTTSEPSNEPEQRLIPYPLLNIAIGRSAIYWTIGIEGTPIEGTPIVGIVEEDTKPKQLIQQDTVYHIQGETLELPTLKTLDNKPQPFIRPEIPYNILITAHDAIGRIDWDDTVFKPEEIDTPEP